MWSTAFRVFVLCFHLKQLMETDGLLAVTMFLQLFIELLKKPYSSPKNMLMKFKQEPRTDFVAN